YSPGEAPILSPRDRRDRAECAARGDLTADEALHLLPHLTPRPRADPKLAPRRPSHRRAGRTTPRGVAPCTGRSSYSAAPSPARPVRPGAPLEVRDALKRLPGGAFVEDSPDLRTVRSFLESLANCEFHDLHDSIRGGRVLADLCRERLGTESAVHL